MQEKQNLAKICWKNIIIPICPLIILKWGLLEVKILILQYMMMIN